MTPPYRRPPGQDMRSLTPLADKPRNAPLLAFFPAIYPSFYPFQHGLFFNRLSTPFLIPFSPKPFLRGVYKS